MLSAEVFAVSSWCITQVSCQGHVLLCNQGTRSASLTLHSLPMCDSVILSISLLLGNLPTLTPSNERIAILHAVATQGYWVSS